MGVEQQVCAKALRERPQTDLRGRAGTGDRPRPYRTAEDPLDIDLLFNEALPIVVDQVPAWEDASSLIETALDGVMLTSPIDLMRIWPAMWPNLTRAKRTTAAGIPILPGFVAVEYQLAGPKMKRRTGCFDLNLIPDPLKWLEERLGPLTWEE
jgi:hypothetical protein